MPLNFAPKGKLMEISKLYLDLKTKRHLENLGVIEGGSIMLMNDSGHDVIVKVKESRLAFNKSLAMKIEVKEVI